MTKHTFMLRLHRFGRAGFTALPVAALLFVACGDSNEDSEPSQLTASALDSKLALASTTGCLIDSDCVTGQFCFQGGCVAECATDNDCGDGTSERCSAQGRCISKAKETKNKRLTRAGSSEAQALTEESSAAVPETLPTAKVIRAPEESIEVEEGAEFALVSIELDAPVADGALLYRVSGQDITSGVAKRAMGEKSFAFELPAGKAAKAGAELVFQEVNLVTSVGGWLINVIPKVKTSGIYEGEVSLNQFGGAALPLKIALDVEPKYAATIDEVTSMKVSLPVSLQSLFSPESVAATDTSTRWAQLAMSKVEGNCASGASCWVASFSTNDFHQGDSQIFGDKKINRAIRVEISAIDMANKRVQGYLRDNWKGLFRTTTSDSLLDWADVTAEGEFLLTRFTGLKDVTPTDHVRQAPDGALGDLSEKLSLDRCLAAGAGEKSVYESMANLAELSCPTTGEALAQADAQTLATCANALASTFLERSDLVSKIVVAYMAGDSTSTTTPDITFAQFLEKCAKGEAYCVDDPELLCTTDILARAYQLSDGEGELALALMKNWQELVRESYLGRHLAAFQNDVQARIDWLQSSEVPQILASAFQAHNETLLDSWKQNVLDVHFGVLGSQLSQHAMEVLARPSKGEAIQATRAQILQDQSSTWAGAMESLRLATKRWNDVYDNAIDRAEKAATVRAHMIDLYTSAVVLGHLNKAAGNSADNASFGMGFTSLINALQQLSLSLNDLVFLRDGEVVVPESLDPLSGNDKIISARKAKAERAVQAASTSIDATITGYQQQKFDNESLSTELNTQLQELASELVNLCGLPIGCTVAKFNAGECEVSVESGKCGFLYDPGKEGEAAYASTFEEMESASTSIGEAGQAILSWRQAILDQQAAQESFRVHQERTQIQYETALARAASVNRWHAQRVAANAQIQTYLDQIDQLNDDQWTEERDALATMIEKRDAAYARQQASVARWNEMSVNGAYADFGMMLGVTTLESAAASASFGSEMAIVMSEAIAEALPSVVGVATDALAPARSAIQVSGVTSAMALGAVSITLDASAKALENGLALQQALREANLTNLQNLAELDALYTENELNNLADRLRQSQIDAERQISNLEGLIEALQRNLEIDITHEQELLVLRDYQDELKSMLAESMTYVIANKRAEVAALQAFMEYLGVVQRAELIKARYDALKVRADNLMELLTSPSVIFSFANRLESAESKLETAKSSLYGWLAAIEYYAVRPFVDQRKAILLARNTTQLEAIALKLEDLVDSCGGAINKSSVILSVRDDLLKVGFDTEVLSAAERFRAILNQGAVPADTLIRYSGDSKIGDVIARGNAKAASFTLDLNSFANLAITCNAKIDSIEIKLVGEGLNKSGTGSLRPTVSFIYDGTSQLRSCQPNIDAIVSVLTPGSTNYGSVTRLKTEGRTVSPVAGVNEFTTASATVDTANYGLQGLPLATTYTLLIDPTVGENKNVDWTKLEDIELRINWAYQDFFPNESTCQ